MDDIDNIMKKLDWNASEKDKKQELNQQNKLKILNILFNHVMQSIIKMFGSVVRLYYIIEHV